MVQANFILHPKNRLSKHFFYYNQLIIRHSTRFFTYLTHIPVNTSLLQENRGYLCVILQKTPDFFHNVSLRKEAEHPIARSVDPTRQICRSHNRMLRNNKKDRKKVVRKLRFALLFLFFCPQQNFVLQLRALRFPIVGCSSRNCGLHSPQLKNKILLIA